MTGRLVPCKDCGQLIDFITTEDGKRIPVDPEMVDFVDIACGQSLIEQDGHRIRKGKWNETDKSLQRCEGYVSHFDTCSFSLGTRFKS